MSPTEPQEEPKSRKDDELFSGTGSERFLFLELHLAPYLPAEALA